MSLRVDPTELKLMLVLVVFAVLLLWLLWNRRSTRSVYEQSLHIQKDAVEFERQMWKEAAEREQQSHEEYLRNVTTMISLLTEIRDLLRARP